mgnify:CR=1 FL=1
MGNGLRCRPEHATTGEQGYVVTDVDGPLPQDVLATLGGSEHCLWVRGFEA